MKLDIMGKLKNCSRVLKIAKKPSFSEFNDSSKICAVGIVALGMIGFLIYLVSVMFLG